MRVNRFFVYAWVETDTAPARFLCPVERAISFFAIFFPSTAHRSPLIEIFGKPTTLKKNAVRVAFLHNVVATPWKTGEKNFSGCVNVFHRLNI